jgi:hypothetical protein
MRFIPLMEDRCVTENLLNLCEMVDDFEIVGYECVILGIDNTIYRLMSRSRFLRKENPGPAKFLLEVYLRKHQKMILKPISVSLVMWPKFKLCKIT